MRSDVRELEELRNRILALPDRELARMAFAEADRYRDEALEIARAELDRRRLGAEILSSPPALGPSRHAAAPDRIRTEPLLPLWIGFAGAALVLTAEVALALLHVDVSSWKIPFFLATAAIYAYWTACVHRIHRVLGEATNGEYPISPGRAVVDLFIPFYCIYRAFAWPRELARFFDSYESGSNLQWPVVGFGTLASYLMIRMLDSALGLALLFVTMAYVYSRIRRAGKAREDLALDWSSRARF